MMPTLRHRWYRSLSYDRKRALYHRWRQNWLDTNLLFSAVHKYWQTQWKSVSFATLNSYCMRLTLTLKGYCSTVLIIVYNVIYSINYNCSFLFLSELYCTGCEAVINGKCFVVYHYSDVIIMAMASQITGVSIVYSTVCSGANQRKHQSSASLAFVRGIHRWPVNSPHKGPVTRKMFPFDDVIMLWNGRSRAQQ